MLKATRCEDGWQIYGKTYDSRELLKSLGGRYVQGLPYSWLLPARVSVAQLHAASIEVESERISLQHVFLDPTLFGVQFDGRGSYEHRDELKLLGARFNEYWQLDVPVNEDALVAYFAVRNISLERQALDVYARQYFTYSCAVDTRRHERLPRYCSCQDVQTCDACMFACCEHAVPLAVNGEIVHFDCNYH